MKINEKLNVENKSLTEENTNVKVMNEEFKNKNADLINVKTEFERLNKELSDENTQYKAKNETLTANNKELTAENQEVKANNKTQGGTGFFKSQFQLQLKLQPLSTHETVAAGIFKTASGWQDAKYYALMDNVDPGTIIKIENPNNNKAIFAKVLDKVSGIHQNDGYDLRMSNAAAIALDIADTDKFFVRVIY